MGENEKENRSKSRCLILRTFQKENGHRMAKKCTKRARRLPESTGFIATSKLQPMNKLEKVSKCYPAENSYQDSILDLNWWTRWLIKGEIRTINDRNICERRSCMKNNGESPTFKFVSGEERRPSELQWVSRGWRLPGATHSSADPTWIRKWLGIQAPELSELKSVEIELGSCCFDLDNKASDEICRTRKKQYLRSHFVFRPRHAPEWLRARFPRSSFSQTKKNWPERLLPRLSIPQTLTQTLNSFSSELPLANGAFESQKMISLRFQNKWYQTIA